MLLYSIIITIDALAGPRDPVVVELCVRSADGFGVGGARDGRWVRARVSRLNYYDPLRP
jgi:hypothetical protein